MLVFFVLAVHHHFTAGRKLLQLQPEKEIIVEFITNPDYKYIRALGAMYLRLVGKPLGGFFMGGGFDIYEEFCRYLSIFGAPSERL